MSGRCPHEPDDSAVCVPCLTALLREVRREAMERAAVIRPVLKGYGPGYETSLKRVAYQRGWDAGQVAMAAAIRAEASRAGVAYDK